MDVNKILSRYPPEMDNLLNMLHDLQDAHPLNYLPEKTLTEVARYLNTTLASVYGVVSYYSMFSTKPRGKHIIRLCQSPICHMMGSRLLLDELLEILDTGLNEPTKDGLFIVELSECLGICDVAPAMMIGDEIYGPLTKDYFVQIISLIREKEKTNM